MSKQCPRCLKINAISTHTCTPTDAWRRLEADRDRCRETLINLLDNLRAVKYGESYTICRNSWLEAIKETLNIPEDGAK